MHIDDDNQEGGHLDDMLKILTDGPDPRLIARLDAQIQDSRGLSNREVDVIRAFREMGSATLDNGPTEPTYYSDDAIAKLAYKAVAADAGNNSSEALSLWWRFLSYTRAGTLAHQSGLSSVADAAMRLGQPAFSLAVGRCALAHYRLLCLPLPLDPILSGSGVNLDDDHKMPRGGFLAWQLPRVAAAAAVGNEYTDPVWVEILEESYAGLPENAGHEKSAVRATLLAHYRRIGNGAAIVRLST